MRTKKITYSDIFESFTNKVIKDNRNVERSSKRDMVNNIMFRDHIVEDLFHKGGIYTIDDAKNVNNERFYEILGDVDNSNWFDITSFDEFKYFTGVTSIKSALFMYCQRLESVTLPESIRSIHEYAFAYTNKLENLVMPDRVRDVEEGLFQHATGLKTVKLSESLYRIPDKAFFCSNIEEIYLPSSIESIGNSAFDSCNKLQKVVIENNSKLHTICTRAFRDSTLKEINLNKGLKTIQNYAFENTLLEKIEIPDSVQMIGMSAFENCVELSHVNIGIQSKLDIISDDAFSYTSLESIMLPPGLKKIDTAFGHIHPKNGQINGHINIYYYKGLNGIDLLKAEYSDYLKYKFIEQDLASIGMSESFTSNVVNKTKKLTQEEKRLGVLDYVDLGLPSGTLWMKWNLGALKKGSYGGLFTLQQALDITKKSGKELPTKLDNFELKENCDYVWKVIDGVEGVEFTSPYNGNSLFIPAAGYGISENDGEGIKEIREVDINGNYWTSTPHPADNNRYFDLHIEKYGVFNVWAMDYSYTDLYFSVRFVKHKKELDESFTSKVIDNKKKTQDDIDNHDGLYILAEITEERILEMYEEWCDSTDFKDPVHYEEQDEYCKTMPYTIMYKPGKKILTMEQRIARSFKQFIYERTKGNLVFRYSPEWGQEKLQAIEFFDFTETKHMRSFKNSIGYCNDEKHPSIFYGREYVDRFVIHRQNENLIKDWYIPVFVDLMNKNPKGLSKKFEKYFI